MFHNPITAQVAETAPARRSHIEFNKWQRLPWMLRCYGTGVCTIASGMPSYFATEEAAEQAGSTWNRSGVAVADQVSL